MKFLFDRSVAFIGLLFLWPIFVVVAILIAVEMPGGPILFRQKRVGKDGKLFTMVKFRSMTVGHGGSSVSVAGENRITPLGAKLRKYKLDELPELWNVLVGDMSFVGPRPDVPGYADVLTGDDREVLALRPGITGPASLKYRDEEDLFANIEKALGENGGEIRLANGVLIHSVREYNDRVIYPDKIRLNRYYLHNYSFWTDIRMIMATVLGRHFEYGGEKI
jgi:lipopolysaccharide/colanic/teichoic acid biosynthesis glycosyltransferase